MVLDCREQFCHWGGESAPLKFPVESQWSLDDSSHFPWKT